MYSTILNFTYILFIDILWILIRYSEVSIIYIVLLFSSDNIEYIQYICILLGVRGGGGGGGGAFQCNIFGDSPSSICNIDHSQATKLFSLTQTIVPYSFNIWLSKS